MFTPEQIRELRESLKLSLTEFAARMGVSYATVMGWEAGRRHPKYDHMVKLNEMAGTSNGRPRKSILA